MEGDEGFGPQLFISDKLGQTTGKNGRSFGGMKIIGNNNILDIPCKKDDMLIGRLVMIKTELRMMNTKL